jgi:hypothetical protein
MTAVLQSPSYSASYIPGHSACRQPKSEWLPTGVDMPHLALDLWFLRYTILWRSIRASSVQPSCFIFHNRIFSRRVQFSESWLAIPLLQQGCKSRLSCRGEFGINTATCK